MTTRDAPWPDGAPCWVDCRVDDPRAAADYYQALFGWDVTETPAETGGYLLCGLDGRRAAGIGGKPRPMHSAWTTYFAAADADALAARVAAAGATVPMEPFDAAGMARMTFAVDPAGAAFGLWEAGTHQGVGVYNVPGAMVWNELHTRDYRASKEFYAAALGYDCVEVGDDDYPYALAHLGDGGDVVAGIQHGTTLEIDEPDLWLVWFGVLDCDAAVQKAATLGSNVLVSPIDGQYGRLSVVQAPQGEVFGIVTTPSATDQGGDASSTPGRRR